MKKFFYLLTCLLAAACQPNQPAEQAAETSNTTTTEPAVNQAVMDLFEEVNVVKMHLFATREADPEGETYPYAGKQFGEDVLPFLPEGVQPNESGGVFACYHVENNDFFILRVPGQEVASDLMLCKWDGSAGKLKKIASLASYRCEGESCQQQDAWLTDLDDDRSLELITREAKLDTKGKILEEKFTVLSQDATGNFIPSNDQITTLAIKDNYVLQQIK